MVTVKDVAREVGLSVTTVSRALNGHDDVAEKTRRRIVAAAQALDYHPNSAARSLQTSKADAIGLVIPTVLHRPYDPFWLEFIGGVASVCARETLDMVISPAETADESSHAFRRLARGRRVDGLLLCDIRRCDPRIPYLGQRLPFLAFGRTTDDQHYPFIDVDGTAGTLAALDHLIGLGHRRIAYLGVDPDFGFSHFRLQGYREALTRAGLPYRPELVCEGLTEALAPFAMTRLLSLDEPPTAIFAAADFLALTALKVARGAGRTVPSDLSIVVFDDNPLVRGTQPPLTAVSQPNWRLGEEAAGMLIARIADPAAPPAQRLIIPTFVVRESTAPAQTAAA